jgi:hypothetical protein
VGEKDKLDFVKIGKKEGMMDWPIYPWNKLQIQRE